MSKIKRFFTTMVLLAAVTALNAGEQKTVTVRVDGLACPFCAYGLEKKLKKIEGVEKLEIKINDGLVTLYYKADAKIDKESITKKVKEAGFTARELQVEGESKKKITAMKGQKISLNIKGMACEGCAGRVEKALTEIDCVQDVKVNLADEKAEFFCSKKKVDAAEFIATIEDLGFKAGVAKNEGN